jgi:hypothetical protein
MEGPLQFNLNNHSLAGAAVVLPYAVADADGAVAMALVLELDGMEPVTTARLANVVADAATSTMVPHLPSPTSDAEALISAYEAARLARRASIQEGKTYQATMRAWIENHGSERARRAIARGYDISGIYLAERLAATLPHYEVHVDTPRGAFRRATDPTLEGMQMLDDIESCLLFEPGEMTFELVSVVGEPGWIRFLAPVREAVYVRRYLGCHTLLIPVVPRVAPSGEETGEADPSTGLEEPDDLPF